MKLFPKRSVKEIKSEITRITKELDKFESGFMTDQDFMARLQWDTKGPGMGIKTKG